MFCGMLYGKSFSITQRRTMIKTTLHCLLKKKLTKTCHGLFIKKNEGDSPGIFLYRTNVFHLLSNYYQMVGYTNFYD